MGERECCFHVRGIPSESVLRDYLDATGAAVPWHRPGSRFGVVREDDLGVVSEDDDVLSAVGYRPNVRQLLHSAHGYVFDAAVVVAIVLTQAQVWTHEDHPHGRLAVMAFLSAGALLFRRVAPFLAPVVCAAGAISFTLLDPDGAYDTTTMFFVLLLASWASGSLLNLRQAGVAFGSVLLAAGWSSSVRRGSRSRGALAQLPARRCLRALGRSGAAGRAGAAR